MNQAQAGNDLYEFGPFRVDAEKQVLLRDGEPVSLTPKTFQVLLVLLRSNNQIVSKDELMHSVWPNTFVEETNLTRNIFALRRALGEDAQNRYIITVSGQGYRLGERVRLVAGQQLDVLATTHSRVQVEVPLKRTSRWIIVAVALALSAGVLIISQIVLRRPVLGAKDTVVLADLENSTGDPVFDGTLRQGLKVQLEQSPYLSLVSDERIRHTLRLMGISDGAKLTPDLARQVCVRTGSAAVIEASIASLGGQYVLGLGAKNCSNGEMLAEEVAQTARKENVLNALTQVASRFRKRVGESLATIDEHNTPLAEATTPSLEALEAYTTAWKVHFSNGASASLPLFKRAAEIDPNFAMAYAALGRIYYDLDESDLSSEYLSKAWQMRARTSDRERFFVTANYQALVTGNMEEARQTCEMWARIYPRDPIPTTLLSGYVNNVAGRYEVALGWARKSIEIDPDFGIAYYSLGADNLRLNRPEEAENALRLAEGRGLELDEHLMLAYDLAFLKTDQAGMAQVAARARQRTGAEGWISNKEAFALAFHGHLREARSATDRAMEYGEHAEQRERAGLWETGAAVREALFGNPPEARRRAAVALSLSHNREVEYGAAFAMARSGELAQAQALTDDLEKRFPEDTSARFSYLPTLRATFALQCDDPAKAIAELKIADPYETGFPRLLIGAMYPVYVRGEALLAQGRGAEAAAEFQKILDHPGVVLSDPVGALAHLQIARAYALSGDNAKSLSAYRDFLAIWKEADADVPILMEAKKEFASLRALTLNPH